MTRSSIELLILWALSFALVCGQVPFRDFEIVESIPVGTTLDNPEIRNTREVWLEMIREAQSTIDLEQFYVSNQQGEGLEGVLQALIDVAARGVRIRLVADAGMAQTYPADLARLDRQKNIEVRRIAIFRETGGVQHSKYFIVDGEQVFIGSQNFDWRALDQIHELGFRITHPEYARTMTKLFEMDWAAAANGESPEIARGTGEKTFQLYPTEGDTLRWMASASTMGQIPADFAADEAIIVNSIDRARERIYIQLLSYSPSARGGKYYEVLDNALRRAALRGVDVRLLLSDWCQRPYEMPYLKSLTVLPNVSVKLSTIPELPDRYISYARVEHCKLMVVDDRTTWLGSSNWKKNYFHGSRNVGITVENPPVNEIVAKIFLRSWDGPYAWKIRPEQEYTPKEFGEK